MLMVWNKRLCNSLLALLLLAALPFAGQASQGKPDITDPYSIVEHVSNSLLSRLETQREQIKLDPDLLRGIVEQEMIPYADITYAAYMVIGKEYRNTSKPQRERFVAAFKDHFIVTFAQLFTEYDGQNIEMVRAGEPGDRKRFVIRTRVIEPGKPEIIINFKLRKGKKSGTWRAYDIEAEGISMLRSKQDELGGLIRQKGIDEVSAMLEELNTKKIVLETEQAS